MHVETMSRSPIGMFLPLDQQPSMQSNPHTFPPFPSPESECFPQWLQFDSPAASSHYSIPAFGGDGTNSPAEAPQTFIFPPTSMETSGGLEGAHTAAPWDDERKPLPSFPATLGRAKRRALDLACITRATPTGLHPPYSPGDSNAVCGFSALPQSSGCYGHLSANDYCWGEQVNDNQVVVSQSESLCMLVDSQESYPRGDDYAAAADGNVVVMEVYADNHAQQQPSFINSYSLSTGMCEEVKAEGLFGAEFAGDDGPTVGRRRNGEERRGISISSDPWGESDVEEDVEEEEEEEGEGEEEEEVEELRQAVEEEVVVEDGEEEKGRRRGGWKRGRRTRRRNRRKQPNDSDEEGSNVADDVFLPGEDDGECSLLNIPTTLVCRWSDCNAIFGDQSALVKHIEKNHVDARSRGGGSGGSASKGSQSSGGSLGEEFACYWHLCPRRTRPFNARYKLLIHMRVHSGDKPNKCPYEGCPKAFSRLENLKIHQRSHTGERPYTCQFPLCPKAFSNSSDRAKHQRTHFDTKPYACQVAGCSKRYTDPSSLRKHVKNHSPKDQTQARRKAKSVDSSSSLYHSKESKCPPSTPPAVTHLTGGLFQDCNSEISSSSTSVKGTFGIQEQPFDDENTGENLHSSNQQFVDDSYTNGDLIGYSSQEVEDDLFFDCFQSLDSMKPLLHAEKESASSSDLQSSTQFELSLDLDCGEVQQDFLEIGVLEKWGVTGTNMVACCTTDDALDSDFLTIS